MFLFDIVVTLVQRVMVFSLPLGNIVLNACLGIIYFW